MCAGRTRPNESQAYGKNSGQCSLIEVMSPMVVPTSSQTVAHATYSNVTRTVAGSAEGEGRSRGSRIRVLIAVFTRAGQSKAGAKSKRLVLLRCGERFASFLRTAAIFSRNSARQPWRDQVTRDLRRWLNSVVA